MYKKAQLKYRKCTVSKKEAGLNHICSSSEDAPSSVGSGVKGRAFLVSLPIPLLPASSSSGIWFSFSACLEDCPKNSPIPFCQVGVGLTHTGFPPAYLLSTFLAGGEGPALALLEPSAFRGARAATTFR